MQPIVFIWSINHIKTYLCNKCLYLIVKMKMRLIIPFILLSTIAQATHIVGGAFSLQYRSGQSYTLTLKVLRDCKNGQAPFDEPATVGLFDKNTHQLMQTFQLDLDSQSTLPSLAAGCPNFNNDNCTQIGVYSTQITLSTFRYNNTAGYYFSYQRCCRNGIINNIVNPGDAGIAIYMEIPSPRFFTNSTPDFSANPNVLLCAGFETTYNFNFTDADFDQLRYSMVTPINGNLDRNNPQSSIPSEGPYPLINWGSGFSNNQQIIGNPSLSIDESTGTIKVAPLTAGVFVVAIKIEEIRNGNVIGEVHLELQLTVNNCPQPIPSLSFRDTVGNPTSNRIIIQVPQSRNCIDIVSEDVTDSLWLTVSMVKGDSIYQLPFEKARSGFRRVTNRVCWPGDCSVNDKDTIQLLVEVKDNGCPFPNKNSGTITVIFNPMPLINATDLLCMTLIDNKETILYWGDSTGTNPNFSKYLLYRSVSDSPFYPIDSFTNKSITSYRDANTPDYATYNYRYVMRGRNTCGWDGPPSDTLGTFQQLKFLPDQQQLIVATVYQKKKVKITWPKSTEPDFAEYLVYKKKQNEISFNWITTITGVNDTSFVDEDVKVDDESYCYHVVMKDTCDNFGPMGTKACTIVLRGKSMPFKNDLNWDEYTYWKDGVERYELWTTSPGSLNYTLAGTTMGNDSAYTDNSLNTDFYQFTYYVVAYNNQPIVSQNASLPIMPFYDAESYSNEVTLWQRPRLITPNVFTPNGDLLNDKWEVADVFVKGYLVQIYNKWGQMVFESTDKSYKWDGTDSKGKEYPSDVYVYRIVYSGYDDRSYNQQGNVTLLR